MPDYRNRPPVDQPSDPLDAMRGMWNGAFVALVAWIIIGLSLYACAVAFGLATRPGWLS